MKVPKIILVLGGVLMFSAAAVLAAQDTTGQPKQNGSSPVPRRIRISGNVMQAKLTHQVSPQYPEEAKQEQLKGTVRAQIVIDCDGKVVEEKVLRGNSVFATAATEALREWRYQPTLVDKVPVQVQTEVELKFEFHRQAKEHPHVKGDVQTGSSLY